MPAAMTATPPCCSARRRYLAETRNFDGTVHFIFQPAEEGGGGGKVMVQEGLFDRFPCERVYGMHNGPALPVGESRVAPGPSWRPPTNVPSPSRQRRACGAMPHRHGRPGGGRRPDRHRAAEHRRAQRRPGGHRRSSPSAISRAATPRNVIPQNVTLRGTARWFKPEVGDLLEAKFTALVAGIAAAFGATAEAVFDRGYPATVNEVGARGPPSLAAQACCRRGAGAGNGAADHGRRGFLLHAERAAGNYIMLGAGRGQADLQVHHPIYDFNDAILPVGASYWATLAEQLLPRE